MRPLFSTNHLDVESNKLTYFATRFRKALVAVVDENTKAGFSGFPISEFPLGACGEASMLLATYFRDQDFGSFDYYFGQRRGKSHAWLQQGELIVDITADQFEDQGCPVIVTKDHAWHSTFQDIQQGSAYFDKHAHYARAKLLRFYNLIVQKIGI